jgi:hypothetical protein
LEMTLGCPIWMAAEGADVPGPEAVGPGGDRRDPPDADPRSPRTSSNLPRPHRGQQAGGRNRHWKTFPHAPQIQSLTQPL